MPRGRSSKAGVRDVDQSNYNRKTGHRGAAAVFNVWNACSTDCGSCGPFGHHAYARKRGPERERGTMRMVIVIVDRIDREIVSQPALEQSAEPVQMIAQIALCLAHPKEHACVHLNC